FVCIGVLPVECTVILNLNCQELLVVAELNFETFVLHSDLVFLERMYLSWLPHFGNLRLLVAFVYLQSCCHLPLNMVSIKGFYMREIFRNAVMSIIV